MRLQGTKIYWQHHNILVFRPKLRFCIWAAQLMQWFDCRTCWEGELNLFLNDLDSYEVVFLIKTAVVE